MATGRVRRARRLHPYVLVAAPLILPPIDVADILATAALRQYIHEQSVVPEAEAARLRLLWVLRYAVLVRQRGIASDKAYLVAATTAE
jgi:hypothetical protein